MIFDILITFGVQTKDLDVSFERSLKSLLTQKNNNWNLVVIGDLEQIESAKNIVQKFKQNQGISNQIDLVQVKTYGSIDLNQAFEYFKIDDRDTHKLLMLESGDYLSPEFLSKSQDFLKSLDLSKNSLESHLAYCDFKYLNSQNQAFDSTFVLKTELGKTHASDFIFRPKLLLRPVQFFWDLGLIKKLGIKFDNRLENQDLKLAKFNLDYILAITQLNDHLLPEPKFCSKAYYISTNPVIETLYGYSDIGWSQVLGDKEEILEKIGKRVWWKYKWLKFWKR